jgi:cytochrome c oxidase assembly protein subunit 15
LPVPNPISKRDRLWPHRLAVVLVCATFPLVWVGGLVTTYDAGMAVPDWPNTYGYNLFLYPWTEWFAGPWDLFIEHAHRLFAATVGIVCIAFVVAVWRTESRRWMRPAAVAALALVIGQGILGGMRVVLDQRTLAMIHGCVGPLFFTYCVLLATLTSPAWAEATHSKSVDLARGILPLAILTALVAYGQLVVGAQLRHTGATATPATFRTLVMFHLIGAAALAILGLYLAVRLGLAAPKERWLRIPASCLAGLILFQAALGCGAWLVNYGWPAWLADYPWAETWVINAKGNLQANITTAHVATGSLILATAAMILIRAIRLAKVGRSSQMASLVRTGAAA